VEVYLHSFLTTPLILRRMVSFVPETIHTWKTGFDMYWKRGWVVCRTGLDGWEKEHLKLPGMKGDCSVL
jgi:hypothetical protein